MQQPIKQLIKYVATINDESLGEDTNPKFELKYVDIGNVDSTGNIHEFATYLFDNAPSRARRIVRDGDIIISTVRTYLQAIAPIQLPPDNLIVSTGFAVVRPKPEKLDSGYCKYAFRESGFLHEVMARSVGVSYPAINTSELSNIPIYVPSLSEQRAIANYLDHETVKIDKLISAKERLLDLLTEKRQSLITNVITCGLNSPTITYKILGEDKFLQLEAPWQPANVGGWKFTQIKHHYKITLGKMLQNSPQSIQDIEVPYLKAQHIQWDKILYEELPTMWASVSEINMLQVRKGDLLVCEGGDIGRATIVKDDLPVNCIIQNALHLVKSTKTGDVRFLKYLLLNAVSNKWLDVICNKATIAHFTVEKFSQMWIWLPPISEQRAIANYLDHETAKIDRLIFVAKNTIKLLQERRTALITAAVTGQIKVAA